MKLDHQTLSMFYHAAPRGSAHYVIASIRAKESGFLIKEWLGLALGFYFARYIRSLEEYKEARARLRNLSPSDELDLASILLGKSRKRIIHEAIEEADERAREAKETEERAREALATLRETREGMDTREAEEA